MSTNAASERTGRPVLRAADVLPRLERLAIPIGLVLYAAWAIYVTWPMLSDPGSNVVGGLSDQTGGIAQVRAWIHEGLFPFAPGTIHEFSAPEGLRMAWGINLSGWPWTLAVWLGALVVGPIAAFGLTTLAGVVLDGVVMQLLATRVTGSRLAGIVAGFAFAFYPFVIESTAGHVAFAHTWPLALMVLAILEVAERPSRRNVVLATLASILALSFTPYYVLIGGVLLATCMAAVLVRAWLGGTLRRQLTAQGAIAASVVGYLAVLALVVLKVAGGQGGTLRTHGLNELYVYAARVHDYFVPFGSSRLFGSSTAPWLQRHEHGSNFSESTLYLGIVVMSLALVGIIAALRRSSDRRLRWGVILGLAVAAVAFVWSAPPEVKVGPVLLPAPSNVIRHFTTTWRVYSRLGIDVMLGTTLLAAVGAATLIRGRRPLVAGAIAVLLLAAVAEDFTWHPGVQRFTSPPVYKILKDRPGGIVAQYPLLPSGFGDSADIFYQSDHGHPMINGYAETGFDDRRASTLYNLNQAPTALGLASVGVRYVVVPDVPVAGTPDPGRPGKGFAFIGRGQYGPVTASVYQVTAQPQLGYVYLRTGGGNYEGPATDPFTWVTAVSAQLSVDTPQCAAPCRGHLHMHMASDGPTRTVILRLPGQRVPLWEGTVGAGQSVTVPLTVHGRREISITTSPGPIVAHQVDPSNPDMRPLSISLGRMSFTR